MEITIINSFYDNRPLVMIIINIPKCRKHKSIIKRNNVKRKIAVAIMYYSSSTHLNHINNIKLININDSANTKWCLIKFKHNLFAFYLRFPLQYIPSFRRRIYTITASVMILYESSNQFTQNIFERVKRA